MLDEEAFISRDSTVGRATASRLDDRLAWGGGSSNTGRVKSFFTSPYRLALGSTQPSIQRVPGALSLKIKRQGH
jgi:hypothetical protein